MILSDHHQQLDQSEALHQSFVFHGFVSVCLHVAFLCVWGSFSFLFLFLLSTPILNRNTLADYTIASTNTASDRVGVDA